MKRLTGLFLVSLCSAAFVCGCSSGASKASDPEAEKLAQDLDRKAAESQSKADGETAELDKQLQQQKLDELQELDAKIADLEAREKPDTVISAADDTERDILRQLIDQQALDKDTKDKLAQHKFELAKTHFADNNLTDARGALLEAIKLNPNHVEATALLQTIDMTLLNANTDPGSVMKSLSDELKVFIQRSRTLIIDHYNRGLSNMEAKQYDDAIKEFELVLDEFSKTTWDVGLPDIYRRAEEEVANAKYMKEEFKKEEERRLREGAEKAAKQVEEKERLLKAEQSLQLLNRATELFEQKMFDKSEKMCEQILKLTTDEKIRTLAADIKSQSVMARQKGSYAKFLQKKIDAWKTAMEVIKGDLIPSDMTSLINYPDEEKWNMISLRSEKTGIIQVEETEDPANIEIKNKLETLKIMGIDFEEANLETLVGFIEKSFSTTDPLTGKVKKQITIIIDSSVPSTEPIPFKVTNATLKEVLNIIADFFNCAYVVKQGIIVFTSKDQATGDLIPDIYIIKDLITPLTNFPSPTLELVDLGGEAVEPEEGPEFSETEMEANLIAMIISNVTSPKPWNEEGTNIKAIPSIGLLYVVNTKEVHKELKVFLSKLRSFTSSMVAIEARFINTYDDFLQDISNEFRDMQGYGLDDLYPDGNADDPGYARLGQPPYEAGLRVNESSGNSESYDLRFMTAYNFLDATGLANENTQLGANLSDQGGLGMQFRMSNEGEPLLQLVTRMVQKDERLTLMAAPKVTAFNTQRAYVMVLQQRAYIRDYSVELASGIRAYDPEIGTLQEGMVFDMRPIISYDKKFVTIEIRVSWLQLALLRNVNFMPGAGTVLQLPWVRNYSTQTTVRVPDRGSLVISGLKQAFDRNISSETPLLGKLPILNFFFSRKAKSTEIRNLLLLLLPEIIDVNEKEANR